MSSHPDPDAHAAFVSDLMDPRAPELPTLAQLIGRPEWMDRGVCRAEPTVWRSLLDVTAWPAEGSEQVNSTPKRAKCVQCRASIEYLGDGEWRHVVDGRKSCSISNSDQFDPPKTSWLGPT